MRLLTTLVLALALLGGGGATAAPLPAPQSLTLTALAPGVWRLTWDPILDDNLMGYSVWARRGRKGDFTKLTRQNVNRALFQFKGLDPARADEFVVVAEYESGRSAPSNSALYTLADRSALEAPPVESAPGSLKAGEAAAVSAAPLTATAAAQPAKGPLAAKKGHAAAATPEPTPEKTPAWNAFLRSQRTLVTQHGRWHLNLGAEYSLTRIVSKGYGKLFESIPWVPVDYKRYDLNATYYWEEIDSRQVFRVPLDVSYGVLPRVEIGAEVAFQNEWARFERASLDGNDYNVSINSPEFQTTAMGDTAIKARAQLLEDWPAVLGLQYWIPTGKSRFASYLDYRYFDRLEAGNGLGVPHLEIEGLLGWRAIKQGVHLQVRYIPSVTESVTIHDNGKEHVHRAVHGDVFEGGLGYTFPWAVGGQEGALVAGALGRSIKAGRWTYDGYDISNLESRYGQGIVRNYSGLNLYDDNQFEVFVEVEQDVNRWMGTGARLFWRNQADGYAFGVSGSVVY